ncbi:hypothetical protein ACKWTF_011436 [Chironomus riparius]
MLSLVGGFFGLFAGFSFLSVGEIIKHFIIYPVIRLKARRSTKVQPVTTKKIQKSQNKIKCYLRTFLKMSTIHSFNHIAKSSKNRFEQLVWAVLFVISMSFVCILVREVDLKRRSSEIVMNLEGIPTKVEDIPFPAFTLVENINDDVKRRDSQYFTNRKEGSAKHIVRIKRLVIDDNPTIDKQVFYTLCGKVLSGIVAAFPFNYTSNSEFVDFLRDYTHDEPPWFVYKNAKWNAAVQPPFAEILTGIGMGHTFNLIEKSKLLYEDRISKDFLYTYDTNNSIDYPWKTSADNNKGFNIQFRTNIVFIGCYNHDSFIIHPPNELPISAEVIRIEDWAETEVLITPTIIKTDEGMKSFDVDTRKCYFDDERKLKYFKIYTQKNCELECLAEIIFMKCGCVPFNSIRNSSTKVCNYVTFDICAAFLQGFSDFQEYDYLYEMHGLCRCLPLCNYVTYSYEAFTKEFNAIENISISIRWKDTEYYALIRYEQFKIVDFLSYVGGILGLFAGISALSVVESLYFFTLRLITDLIRYYRQ